MFRLAMLNELTLELGAGIDDRILRWTANIMSKRSNDWTAQSVSYSSEQRFLHQHLRFRLADTIAALGESTPLSIKNLSLTFSKNVMRDIVFGTLAPEDILNQQVTISGEIELNYEDRTYANYMLDGTYKAMEIDFVNTDSTIGSGSRNAELKMQFPRVDFFEWESNRPNDEISTQVVQFRANYDLANLYNAIYLCQLTNTRTTAY